jgi:hypothetical protein
MHETARIGRYLFKYDLIKDHPNSFKYLGKVGDILRRDYIKS